MIDGGAGFDVVAAAAINQILAEPNCATYFLAGYSFGGFVAWEVAYRLTQLGRQVGFVGLIDTRQQNAVRKPETPARWLKRKLRDLRDQPRSAFADVRWKLIFPLALRICPRPLLREIGDFALRRQFTSAFGWRLMLRTRLAAVNTWNSQPLRVPTYLFRSDEFIPETEDFNWGRLCGQLQVIPVSGTHQTLFESPNFQKLTQAFLEAVQRAAAQQVRSTGRGE
jgi:thioesterase domain-containing protein